MIAENVLTMQVVQISSHSVQCCLSVAADPLSVCSYAAQQRYLNFLLLGFFFSILLLAVFSGEQYMLRDWRLRFCGDDLGWWNMFIARYS